MKIGYFCTGITGNTLIIDWVNNFFMGRTDAARRSAWIVSEGGGRELPALFFVKSFALTQK